MTKRLPIILTLVLVLQSCGAPMGGNAPSPPLINTPTPTFSNYKVTQKNAKNIVTSNGWAIDEDHTNIVKTKTLTSGWQVEAVYE